MDGDPRPEAPLVAGDGGGLTPGGPGWFVLDAAEAQWLHNPDFGDACVFEGRAEGAGFTDDGLSLRVVVPGQPNCRYHGETGQEYAGCLERFEVQPRADLLPRWRVAAPDGGLGGGTGSPGAGAAGARP